MSESNYQADLAQELANKKAGRIAKDAGFSEGDHPRADNGQFGAGGGGGSKSGKFKGDPAKQGAIAAGFEGGTPAEKGNIAASKEQAITPGNRAYQAAGEKPRAVLPEGQGWGANPAGVVKGPAPSALKTVSKSEAKSKIQGASKEALMKAYNSKDTDPAVRKMVEAELDDRANRGS